jgi:hypothetical protein
MSPHEREPCGLSGPLWVPPHWSSSRFGPRHHGCSGPALGRGRRITNETGNPEGRVNFEFCRILYAAYYFGKQSGTVVVGVPALDVKLAGASRSISLRPPSTTTASPRLHQRGGAPPVREAAWPDPMSVERDLANNLGLTCGPLPVGGLPRPYVLTSNDGSVPRSIESTTVNP